MSDQTRKWKDEAVSLIRKGRHEKALGLLRKVVAENPADYSSATNVGNLLRKLGRNKEAAEVFVKLAEEYAGQGFLLKAIASCKMVLEVDPNHKKIQQRLADLYAHKAGMVGVAIKIMEDPAQNSVQVGPEATVPLVAVPVLDEAGEEGLTGFQTVELPSPEPIELPPEQEPAAAGGQSFGVELTTNLEDFGAVSLPPEEEAPPAHPVLATLESTPAIEEQSDDSLDLVEPVTETPAAPQAAEVPPAAEASAGDPPVEEAADSFEIDVDVEEGEPLTAKTLPEIPLFSDLGPDAFVAVMERMKLVRMKPGDWIIREGAFGDSMFTVASGAVRILKKLEGSKMIQLAVLGEGAFFGEMAVLRGGPRVASVQAVKGGELFEVTKELLDRILVQFPAVGEVLKKFAKQRLLRNVMVTSELFRPFTQEERVRIIERFAARDVEPGDVLISQGKESNGLYIVLRGKLDVLCNVEDGSQTLAGTLAEGEVFGEISCLHKEPAVATVKASSPVSILRLPRKDFDDLILSHPQILELVARLGEERRALTTNALAAKGILI